MKYHNITKDDMLNGTGLRVVLWVSGCSHHCLECHNPVTWDPSVGVDFTYKTKEELFVELGRDRTSGITLSGGDPLFVGNRETILNLVKEIKEKFATKNIWLYTGYRFEDVSALEIMKYVDVVVDGKYVKELGSPDLEWRGSSNQRVIKLGELQQVVSNSQCVALSVAISKQNLIDGDYPSFGGFNFFWKPNEKNGVFSQTFNKSFWVDGVQYDSVFRYMMAARARMFNDDIALKGVMSATSLSEIGDFGYHVSNFNKDIWAKQERNLLYTGNSAKFSQNEDMRVVLLHTYPSILAYTNPKDLIYGIGMCSTDLNAKNPNCWLGDNLLGFVLMDIRENLR